MNYSEYNINSKNRLRQIAVAIALSGVALVGCDSTRETRKGATMGALAGAVVGTVIGHQSGEEGEGAVLGAAAGAAIGGSAAANKQRKEREERLRRQDRLIGSEIDYGDLMTEVEKDKIRERSGKTVVDDWGEHLTSAEKKRLLDRAEGDF